MHYALYKLRSQTQSTTADLQWDMKPKQALPAPMYMRM